MQTHIYMHIYMYTCPLFLPPPHSHSHTPSPASLVSQSVWWHYLVINVPDKLEFPDTAFIYITGGSNHDGCVVCASEHTPI